MLGTSVMSGQYMDAVLTLFFRKVNKVRYIMNRFIAFYASQREYGMIKRFCSTNPQAKEKDYKQFCKTFNALANGDDIWPKYLTMIKPAVKRFEINQRARLILLKAGESYTSFINKLNSAAAANAGNFFYQ